jgi:phosphopantetheine--protein transferase-like protein
MDGNPKLDSALAFVSRLTGHDVAADERLGLRSIQRVALTSWARAENVTLRGALIDSGAPFTMRDLLTPAGLESSAAAVVPAAAGPAPMPASAAGLIGIDIEDVASLPEAEDYREHPFYRDNFTPAEIAYCLRQGDPRASLCGVWAAKEAILKTGLASAALLRLIDIEILRDEWGRPGFANCAISISHTGQAAVAVCMTGLPPGVAPALVSPIEGEAPAMPQMRKSGYKRRMIMAGAAVLIVMAGWVVYQRGGGFH